MAEAVNGDWEPKKVSFVANDGEIVDTGQWMVVRTLADGTMEPWTLAGGEMKFYRTEEVARVVCDQLNAPLRTPVIVEEPGMTIRVGDDPPAEAMIQRQNERFQRLQTMIENM